MSKPSPQVMPLELCLAHLSHYITHAIGNESVVKLALEVFASNHTEPAKYIPLTNSVFVPYQAITPAQPASAKAAPISATNVYQFRKVAA